MNTLSIDIETYSSVDITKSGVYKYVESPDFEILMLAYCFNDGEVYIIDLAAGEKIPDTLKNWILDPGVLKTAYNAQFERLCISRHLGVQLDVRQWECTMVKAAMCGYPFGLDAVAKVLKLENQKDAAGKNLIRYFSIPCKPTKVNGQRTRNLPEHDTEKWSAFKNYCIKDVKVENEIREAISFFNIPEEERELWYLDQEINDTGVLLDPDMVFGALSIHDEYITQLNAEAIELTQLNNPNSAAQLKTWLTEQTGVEVSSLTKKDVPELIESTSSKPVKRVLEIRQEMAKTSVKKYTAMESVMCQDKRVRGLLQFYGANRTGRWAGRLVQVQNLPQNHIPDLELAREVVTKKDTELLALLFGNVPDILSQLIRTAFVAKPGNTLLVADFSAIEARVIAWLAGEAWRLDVFKTHGKIYEASASQMFKIPIEKITKGSDLRQKGKVSELALGYQGGPGALINMGALNMGLSEGELPALVKMWRNANKKIVKLWYDVEAAAISAVEGSPVQIQYGTKFYRANNCLIIQLPSGRKLYYLNPRLRPNQFGSQAIIYDGMNQTTKTWGVQETYGGKLVENIVQAIARDCLAVSMLRIKSHDYSIVMSVHDEIVAEGLPGQIDHLCDVMSEPIPWANGLPLKADGYETPFYKKD